jgi:hypothetical protein
MADDCPRHHFVREVFVFPQLGACHEPRGGYTPQLMKCGKPPCRLSLGGWLATLLLAAPSIGCGSVPSLHFFWQPPPDAPMGRGWRCQHQGYRESVIFKQIVTATWTSVISETTSDGVVCGDRPQEQPRLTRGAQVTRAMLETQPAERESAR